MMKEVSDIMDEVLQIAPPTGLHCNIHSYQAHMNVIHNNFCWGDANVPNRVF